MANARAYHSVRWILDWKVFKLWPSHYCCTVSMDKTLHSYGVCLSAASDSDRDRCRDKDDDRNSDRDDGNDSDNNSDS